MKAVVFLGPSLPLNEAREIFDGNYLPPAAQSDIATAVTRYRPDVIALIDGVFLQSLSVWHKEILFALNEGVRLYGASSMGALRAAETSPFGMIGVGKIYKSYQSGELVDDDEVALSYTVKNKKYRKTSEPMVNIRATFIAAQVAGIITVSQLGKLEKIAKGLYFAQRTFREILDRSEDLPVDIRERLLLFTSTNYVDLKACDARELLAKLKVLSEGKLKPEVPTFEFNRSHAFETLYGRDRRVPTSGEDIPLESVSNYVALHDPKFENLNRHALNSAVVMAFGEILGLVVTGSDIDAECAIFRKRNTLLKASSMKKWLRRNHLDEKEFRLLMTQLATCRRLHRWFLSAAWMERSSKAILDELRLDGIYPDWVDATAVQEGLISQPASRDELRAMTLPQLVKEHNQWVISPNVEGTVEWAEDAGFHTIGNLTAELRRAAAARRNLLILLSNQRPNT